MSKISATEALTELARAAAWGLVKGGDLDSRQQDGDAALIERHNILDAAASAGIRIDYDGDGIGEIYSRSELEDQ